MAWLVLPTVVLALALSLLADLVDVRGAVAQNLLSSKVSGTVAEALLSQPNLVPRSFCMPFFHAASASHA